MQAGSTEGGKTYILGGREREGEGGAGQGI